MTWWLGFLPVLPSLLSQQLPLVTYFDLALNLNKKKEKQQRNEINAC